MSTKRKQFNVFNRMLFFSCAEQNNVLVNYIYSYVGQQHKKLVTTQNFMRFCIFFLSSKARNKVVRNVTPSNVHFKVDKAVQYVKSNAVFCLTQEKFHSLNENISCVLPLISVEHFFQKRHTKRYQVLQYADSK